MTLKFQRFSFYDLEKLLHVFISSSDNAASEITTIATENIKTVDLQWFEH